LIFYQNFISKFSSLVVEQESFQLFASQNYEDVDLKALVFDANPLKIVKDACPIAKRQKRERSSDGAPRPVAPKQQRTSTGQFAAAVSAAATASCTSPRPVVRSGTPASRGGAENGMHMPCISDPGTKQIVTRQVGSLQARTGFTGRTAERSAPRSQAICGGRAL